MFWNEFERSIPIIVSRGVQSPFCQGRCHLDIVNGFWRCTGGGDRNRSPQTQIPALKMPNFAIESSTTLQLLIQHRSNTFAGVFADSQSSNLAPSFGITVVDGRAKDFHARSALGKLGRRDRRARRIYCRKLRCDVRSNMMANNPPTEVEVLRAAYAAFNARDADAALALMSSDVAWPRAFKGGFVQGKQAIRAYWTGQWSEIDPHVEPVSFHPEDTGCILVEVHLVVRDLAGAIRADEHVGQRFTMKHGLIQRMEICASPTANRNT